MSKTEQQTGKCFAVMESPIGCLSIIADDHGILEIRFPNNTALPSATNKANEFIEQAIDQLRAYFDGRLKVFDLPLNLNGTDFQKGVWAQLQKIGYGATASYRDVAVAIGNPKASRAVGMANNKNKIPIVIPCHRVIGSNGSLTGFAGGLDTKRWLLNHERVCVGEG
ncbi:MAG: cysteine methyltransferase [Gammaproteobacteria bacterium]|nr:MAG: cysteine methyltransferase [Gammaproteobacteria bacterium]RLA51872.1 MAG: cysteine methyltransferase [Gammaproteobacteria bacterium]